MWHGWTFFELYISSFIIYCIWYHSFSNFHLIRVVAEIRSWASHVTCSTFLCLLISHTLLLAPNYINPFYSPSYLILSVNIAGQWHPFNCMLLYFSANWVKLYTLFLSEFSQIILYLVSLILFALASIDWSLNPELFSVHTWSNKIFFNFITWHSASFQWSWLNLFLAQGLSNNLCGPSIWFASIYFLCSPTQINFCLMPLSFAMVLPATSSAGQVFYHLFLFWNKNKFISEDLKNK